MLGGLTVVQSESSKVVANSQPISGWSEYLIGRHRDGLLVVILLCLIAYGFVMFNMTLAGDDWSAVWKEGNQYDVVVSLGRWLQRYIWMVFADKLFAPAFTLSFMVALWLVGGLLALRFLAVDDRFAGFAFLGLFVLTPFWAEMVNFKNNHPNAGLATLLALASGLLAWRMVQGQPLGLLKALSLGLASSLCLALSASGYQAMAPMAPMIFLLGWMRALLRNGFGEVAPTIFVKRLALMVVIFGCGIFLYGLSVYVTQTAYGLGQMAKGYALSGSLVSSTGELQMTLARFLAYFEQFLFLPQHLVPQFAKWLFLGLLAVYPLALIRRGSKQKPSNAVWYIGVGLLLACGFLVLPWLLGIMRTPNSYRYNGIVSLALVYAGFALIALECGPRLLTGRLVKGLALTLILIFVFQHNAASFVTYNLNRRDWSIATRMIERIEAMSDLEAVTENGAKPLIVYPVGRLPTASERPYAMPAHAGPMDSSIVECGVLNCHTIRLYHLLQLSASKTIRYDRSAGRVGDRKVRRLFREPLSTMRPWPHPTSIKLLPEGILIVLLGDDGP